MSDYQQIQIIFKKHDINGDGKLDEAELDTFLRETFSPISPSEVLRLFQLIDSNNDGEISYEEFLTLYDKLDGVQHILPVDTKRISLRELFQLTDTNGDGTLDSDEIRNLMVNNFLPNEAHLREVKRFIYEMTTGSSNGKKIDGITLYKITEAVSQFGGCLRTMPASSIKN